MYSPLYQSHGQEFAKLVFAERLSKANAVDAVRKLALLGGVLSAAVVESKFRPELLPRKPMQRVLNDLIEVLLQI
jgi:hypothetical protein